MILPVGCNAWTSLPGIPFPHWHILWPCRCMQYHEYGKSEFLDLVVVLKTINS